MSQPGADVFENLPSVLYYELMNWVLRMIHEVKWIQQSQRRQQQQHGQRRVGKSQTVLMNWASLAVCTVPGVLSAIASDICYLLKTSGFTIHPAEEETPGWRQTEVKGYTLVNPPKNETFLQFRPLFSSSRIGWCHVCISTTHKRKLFSRW